MKWKNGHTFLHAVLSFVNVNTQIHIHASVDGYVSVSEDKVDKQGRQGPRGDAREGTGLGILPKDLATAMLSRRPIRGTTASPAPMS